MVVEFCEEEVYGEESLDGDGGGVFAFEYPCDYW